MQLAGLLQVLRASTAYQRLLEALRAPATSATSLPGGQPLPLGVLRTARPYVLAALSKDWPGPVLYIAARPEAAYNTAEQLPVWLQGVEVTRFSEPTPGFYERAAWGEGSIRGRIGALAALLPPDDHDTTRPPVVVTSARALMQRTLPPGMFRSSTLLLRPGAQQDINALLTRLVQVGYESVPLVVEPGTFSRRGGLVDVFPVAAQEPVRIEFFDIEVDSLRAFDPATQRSTHAVSRLVIPPAREALPYLTPAVAETLRPFFVGLAPAQQDDATSPSADANALALGTPFAFLEFYLPYLMPNPVSLLDYAPDNALIVVEDWDDLRDTVEALEDDAEGTRAERLATGELPDGYPHPYVSWPDLEAALRARRTLQMDTAPLDADLEEALGTGPNTFGGLFEPGRRFGGQLNALLEHLRKLSQADGRVVVVTDQAQRLAERWREADAHGAQVATDLPTTPDPASVRFVPGVLGEGWTLRPDGPRLHLFTDAEVFGWQRPEPRRRPAARRARLPEAQYADWREGDYVVHEDFGVGQFAGMRRRTIDDVEREYLLVNYAGGDQLFVPIHQADRLTRYIGTDEKPPQLTRLGQQDWLKVTARSRKAAEEEARELLALYAARARTPGIAYSPDGRLMHELEASFPYVETDDQVRAIVEVKADMEQAFPMDRLICADAGYGKTEVALRAAFKATLDGKQVAVLVPTTVLAQQHYDTFRDRLEPFPVTVEVLSRFRTADELNKAADRIASGQVDIIIGTHRILQKDIHIPNLGLVIIDEEQRFGVRQKEHFKGLRTQVDVLTLTATPIPRTMYMALTGVRDISMIQTPPEERLPVITHVGVFDDRLARSAVLREMERGGQVFMVHNRIRTLDRLAERMASIVPEARVVSAHGQLDGRTLAAIMRAFGRGEYDVLLSTSIVENGLDIPTANTLIVDQADMFGLSQLYQLRGRVGRSAQQAYAYFFHPPHNKLTDEGRARLDTLAENSQLGAGYQIALRDLELRGAGDILSTRQSGQIAAVGLNLYTQMLQQAVADLKANPDALDVAAASAATPAVERAFAASTIAIDLPLPAYLPTDYIPEIALRLQLYRRIADLHSAQDVQNMRDELADRFGKLPDAVDGLLYQMDVKVLAREAGATAVQARKGVVYIRLPYLPEVDREDLADTLADAAGADVVVTRTAVEMPLALDADVWRARLLEVLERLASQAYPAPMR